MPTGNFTNEKVGLLINKKYNTSYIIYYRSEKVNEIERRYEYYENLQRDSNMENIKNISKLLRTDLKYYIYFHKIFNTDILPFFQISEYYRLNGASLVAQLVKNLPAMQETWIQSLSWEDDQEEGMATHSNILAWRIPMDRGA